MSSASLYFVVHPCSAANANHSKFAGTSTLIVQSCVAVCRGESDQSEIRSEIQGSTKGALNKPRGKRGPRQPAIETDTQLRRRIAAFENDACDQSEPADRPTKKLRGDRGLWLFLRKGDTPTWRVEFEDQGVRRAKVIGHYFVPSVSRGQDHLSLADARKRAFDVREKGKLGLLREGVEPLATGPTFLDVAQKWRKTLVDQRRSKRHLSDNDKRLKRHVNSLFARPIASITEDDIRAILQPIVDAKHGVEARKTLGIFKGICEYAVLNKLGLERSPIGLLGKWVSKNSRPVQHVAALTDPKDFGKLLRDIDQCPSEITRRALQIQALVALRPGQELIKGRWEEIDFDKALWKIPSERMKKRNEFWVPLSRQALGLLKELKTMAGDSRYLFPSETSNDGALAAGTMSKALNKMGYFGRHVPHGFRASFQSIVKEQRVIDLSLSEAVDVQLAHKRQNEGLGYDRSRLLEQRREVMQRWADYCDQLRKQ